MAEKIGCFVCTGCGIGEALDTDKLLEIATSEKGAALAKSHPALCKTEGLELLRSEIESAGLDAVVIGACSGRDHTAAFALDKVFVERASLREGVV